MCLFVFLNYGFDSRAEKRQIVFNDVPNLVQIDSEVTMDNHIAESAYAAPINIGPGCFQGIGYPLSGLGQSVQVTQDGVLSFCIREKVSFPF